MIVPFTNHPVHGDCYYLIDAADLAFAKAKEGKTFRNRQLPSGWTTPDVEMVIREGRYLVRKAERRTSPLAAYLRTMLSFLRWRLGAEA